MTEPVGSREPMREERLKASIFYSMLGQAVYVAAQFGVLAALARFAGVVAVGEFGLAMAIATPVFLLANLGVRTGQATDAERRYEFNEYAGLTVASALIGIVVSLAIGMAFFGSTGGMAVLFMVSANKAVEAISILAYGTYQQAGRLDLSARSLCIRGVLSVVAFVALLALGAGTAVALSAQFVVWSLVAFGSDYRRASQLASGRLKAPVFAPRRMYLLARENAPLGIGQFLSALTVSLPRLMLKWYVGIEAVGIFTLVYYFFQAGTMIANAVAQAVVGRFAVMWRSGRVRQLRRTALRLTAAAVACSAAGLLVVAWKGGAILELLFGPEARAGDTLLVLIACALSLKLVDLVPQSVLNAQRRFHGFLASQILALVTSALLLPLLVPEWGLVGAGVAVVGVAAVRLATLLVVLLRPASPQGDGR